MRKNYFLLIVILFSVLVSVKGSDLTTLKKKYLKLLVPQSNHNDTLLNDLILLPVEQKIGDQMVQELMNKYPLNIEKIKQYLSLLQPDGSFADINYKDKKRTSWQPKQHTERVLELCKLYASDTTPLYHDKQIEKQIHQILGFWFRNMPECSNWWQNEIGIPRTLGQAFLIFEDQLNEEERNGALSVMNKAHFGMTGQNKVWLASNMMIKGLLTDDELLVKQARDTIVSEITTEGVDGIQPDWSYHLHGPQQQFGNYGLAFLSSMSFFYKLFENTSYQLTDHQRSILVNLVEKGYKWVIWHRHMDISSLGRQLFMHASTHKGYMTAFCAQDLGISGFPLDSNPLVGHKHFPYSDYTIHRTPTWMASLKMHSCRTIGSEHVNEDNIRGFYLGDGATYFYMDKDDYMDALPCWDWRKVPGTTAYESKIPVEQKYRNERNSSSMVGGISEGMYGVSAMDYSRDHLKAKKAWFFTPDAVVCLGAGIHSDSILHVTTAIDQRLSRGPLIRIKKGKKEIISRKVTIGKGRLFHHNIGYVMLQDSHMIAEASLRTGLWADNMGAYSNETATENITTIYIDHGAQPHNESYAYIVMPNTTVEKLSHFKEKDLDIIRNDENCQIVGGKMMNDNYWGVFYAPGNVIIHHSTIHVEKPGLYQFKESDKEIHILQSLIF